MAYERNGTLAQKRKKDCRYAWKKEHKIELNCYLCSYITLHTQYVWCMLILLNSGNVFGVRLTEKGS